ncbi:hypothetical protein GCM10020256_16780 [Streptomyces thermocoprophilus]
MTTPAHTKDHGSALRTLLRPHRLRLTAAIACGLLDQALALTAALLGAALVGRALNGATSADLLPQLLLLAALVAPKVLAAWAESYLAHDLAFRVLAELRDRCYRALSALTPGYLLRRRSGDIGATAMADIELLELFFAHSLSPLVVAASVPPGLPPRRIRRGPPPRRRPPCRPSPSWPPSRSGCVTAPPSRAGACARPPERQPPKRSTPSKGSPRRWSSPARTTKPTACAPLQNALAAPPAPTAHAAASRRQPGTPSPPSA